MLANDRCLAVAWPSRDCDQCEQCGFELRQKLALDEEAPTFRPAFGDAFWGPAGRVRVAPVELEWRHAGGACPAEKKRRRLISRLFLWLLARLFPCELGGRATSEQASGGPFWRQASGGAKKEEGKMKNELNLLSECAPSTHERARTHNLPANLAQKLQSYPTFGPIGALKEGCPLALL